MCVQRTCVCVFLCVCMGMCAKDCLSVSSLLVEDREHLVLVQKGHCRVHCLHPIHLTIQVRVYATITDNLCMGAWG